VDKKPLIASTTLQQALRLGAARTGMAELRKRVLADRQRAAAAQAAADRQAEHRRDMLALAYRKEVAQWPLN